MCVKMGENGLKNPCENGVENVCENDVIFTILQNVLHK